MPGTGVHFLVGDIGGTRVRLRVVEADREGWRIRHEAEWHSHDFDSLETAVLSFLDELSRSERCALQGAWLAVAGPVIDGRVQFTNLPWETDRRVLSSRLALPEVHLVNDLEAMAHIIPALDRRSLVTIQRGRASPGRGLLVSVGTGLGMTTWSGRSCHLDVLPSEGGHSDFAPRTEWQAALSGWMDRRYRHVSYERLASGTGLAALYDFIHEQAGSRPADEAASDRKRPAEIVRRAGVGDERACEAIDQFARILGAFCGNAALHAMATGGVYLAGGVIRSIHPYLSEDNFNHPFRDKGRMETLLRRVPVHALTSPEPGLEGITRLAMSRDLRSLIAAR
ncbi:MAG: ROK family protein [Pseudomonadota bacterium]